MTVLVRAGAPLIALLVDRSGSMASCLVGMESGLNMFVARQAALPGDAAVMLAQFDDSYEVLWPMRPLRSAPRYRLAPRGGTALHDAIGHYLTDVEDVVSVERQARPVIVAIVTDGEENTSKEWTKQAVRARITQLRDVRGWTFVFLGANIDAVGVGATFGISAESALTFRTGNATQSYAALNRYVTQARAGHTAAFGPDDRRKAIER
jgi:uncharacterized protein YegL